MEFARSLIIFLILGTVLTGIHFTFSGRIMPLHYDDPPYLSSRSNMTDRVLVAREAADVDKPLVEFAAGKDVDFVQLVESGRFFFVRDGTGIIVLERGSDISKVRIREDGREGYVHNDEIIAE
jgi:hypothetical protein